MNIEQLNPKHNPKYSKNLYNWLRRRQRERPDFPDEKILLPVFRCENGMLWIGSVEENLFHFDCISKAWFIGCMLIEILCNGASQKDCAYRVGYHMKELHLIPDFWEQYLADGRCAIDREHQMSFIGDESRWKVDGSIRDCLWCGKHRQSLVKWEEIVCKEEWKPVKKSPSALQSTTEDSRP